MPLHSSSIFTTSKSRKSNGFSIDDIIKNDDSSKTFSPSPNRSLSYLPPMAWIPSPTSIYQFQRDSIFQYFRHNTRFTNPDVATAYILNSFRKPKRNRTAFTPSQLLKLENAFEKSHYIVGEERKELARHLNLSETKVKVWYQNRRTKHKRLITEDENSSTNEIDHQNESETSDTTTTKNDDEHVWNNENNHNHSDDYYLNLTKNNSKENHRQQRSCSS